MIHSGSRGLGHQVATGNLINNNTVDQVLSVWYNSSILGESD